ncbi:MAG: PAS domain-containing sensor histidine kinase, partial [Halobacteria archaeon]|nr:PAS domain-containing sensor histidine kinase [Halobacteria archaeon]
KSNHNDISGYSRDELAGMNIAELMDSDTLEEVMEKAVEIGRSEDLDYFTVEYDMIRKNDERLPVEARVSLLPAVGDKRPGSVSVTRDISERKEREEEIKQKNRQLELLNRIVRHDIRNDMNIIHGRSEFLVEDLDGERKDDALIINEISNEVIDLTEALRDLMQSLTTGEPELVPVSLREVLGNEVKKCSLSFDNAEFEVGEIPDVEVEANEMLSSVFTNLLNNAVRHNDKPEPRIEVGVKETDDEVVVSVADNGPGVPDENKDEIFGRGEKGLESPGSGIGLYLVDTLVTQYDGEVWVEDNDDEPEGSVFKVRLKKAV